MDGIAPEYLQPYEELISQNRIRIEIAELIRNFRLNNLNQFYDAEKLAAEQNYKVNDLLFFKLKNFKKNFFSLFK